jgi:DNA-binding transcriptional ArsR family regulator
MASRAPRGTGTTMFYPGVSEQWADRAAEVGGAAGFTLAVLIWQTVKLAFRSRGRDPYVDGVVFTYGRVRKHVPMARSTYSRALRKLAEAGLIELHCPGRASGNRVRVLPIRGEEEWTRRRLQWR